MTDSRHARYASVITLDAAYGHYANIASLMPLPCFDADAASRQDAYARLMPHAPCLRALYAICHCDAIFYAMPLRH